MKNKIKYVALLMFIIIFSGCSMTGQTDNPPAADGQQNTTSTGEKKEQTEKSESEQKNKGVAAPTFTLKDMNGNEVALADLQGKKVYLKFWASWCHFCTQGMPDLAELVDQDNDFEIYTIVAPGYNREYSEEEFKTWYEQQGYSENIKVLFDQDGTTMRAYGISGYPTNAFIGSDGILVSKLPGSAPNEDIKERMGKIQ
ncbi:TlpA family protein disulfide reductase [Clostridiales bacterium COT073_COT-073]|nr:TlpA family protein disulfide reductase [Clostridiales bacterium COT073_COT-073]